MSRLRTLVRVAELQEAAARGRAAAALAATRAAELEQARTLAHLRSGGVAGGLREALARTTQLQLVRAAAVSEAEQQLDDTRAAQHTAVQDWTERRRRHRLFTELAERERDALRVRREKADQQLADELAARR